LQASTGTPSCGCSTATGSRGDGRKARHLVEIALWAVKIDVAIKSVQDVDTFRDLLYAVVTDQRNHEDSKRKGAASAGELKPAVYRGEYGGQPLDGYRVLATVNKRGHVKKRLDIDPERRDEAGAIVSWAQHFPVLASGR
jgi:hypothetical protein